MDISTKDDVNPPSFYLFSFVPESKYTSNDHCVFVSCWAFLCRFGNRFLAEPTSSRTGNRPAFFVLGHGPVRRNLPPEAPMLLFDSPDSFYLTSAGITFIQRFLASFPPKWVKTYNHFPTERKTKCLKSTASTAEHLTMMFAR